MSFKKEFSPQVRRCEWCEKDELYRSYHDNEWGVIQSDESKLFELLCLECLQAGLSWHIILKKRAAFKRAFKDFKPKLVLAMSDGELEALSQDKELIRHKAKIFSLRDNAKAFLTIAQKNGSFYKFLWDFCGGEQIILRPKSLNELNSQSELSIALAKRLKKAGVKFIGPISAYSFLQACGVIDEHLAYCFKA